MWGLIAIVLIAVSSAVAQNGRTSAHQDHGHGWDIRLAVPGEPGRDYPTLGSIPRTSFSCAGKGPGYYADLETNCQVFRVCTVGSTYGFQSFLCPNGTLFNQAVFVCDWWMNVNCQQSQRLVNNNNEKFGNLRLGPQLMKDIKKMLTHPMRNPYDKNAMKSNLIVMHEYIPPHGQLFPSGALTANSEKPNNVYIPAKQILPPIYSPNEIEYAASTLSPRYVPAPFNTIQPSTQRDSEIFQRQQVQSNRQQNSQIRQQNTNFGNTINSNSQAQYRQQQVVNSTPIRGTSTQNPLNIQRGQLIQQQNFNNNVRKPSKQNNGKQTEYSVAYTKQQYSSNQQKQPYTYQQPQMQFSNLKYGDKIKQNLVSANNNIPSTVITKTLTLKRIIQDPKRGSPKSRITVKTWIVKPSKSAKIIQSSPYTYERPTQSPAQKLIDTTPYAYTYNRPTTEAQLRLVESSPYTYERPTQPPAKLIATTQNAYTYNKPKEAQKIISEPDGSYVYNKPSTPAKQIASEPDGSYVYNKPSTPAKQIASEPDGSYVYNKPSTPAKQIASEPDEPYVYNRPSTPAKQIVATTKQPIRIATSASTPRTTLSRLYLSPTPIPPTQSSRLYLPPTTYNPSSRLYLPPSQAPLILSRQYLTPTTIQQTTNYFNEKLRASQTTPYPTFALPDTDDLHNPSNTPLEKSEKNNANNLTFTDILTKQRLDNTVNNIVKDTSKILNTAPPVQFEQFRDVNSIDYQEETYLPPHTSTDSGENLTLLPPTTVATNARLVSSPSEELEPPMETLHSNQNSNQLSNLPFYKESNAPRNTIERTVSLKISIPEKIADYLFKSHNDSDFDKLEILNTGSSNYLVLTNNMNKISGTNFIPIGKLISDKPSNISNSQALVYSLLADSINVAKEYNLAQQRTSQPTSTQTQPQNIENEDIEHITDMISHLTSSQFSKNNQADQKSGKLIATTPGTSYNYNRPQTNQLSQTRQQSSQNGQYNIRPNQFNQEQNFNANLEEGEPIYSGQLYKLPVPDVTSQIYNKQSTYYNQHNQLQSTVPAQQNQHPNENIDITDYHRHNDRPSNNEVEEVKTNSLPIDRPARLEVAPTDEIDHFNQDENIEKIISSNNGISAQLQDKIVGNIAHPLENNKFITYKKDESYYVYTKLDDILRNIQNTGNSIQTNTAPAQKSAKIIQGDNLPNIVAFQLIPSVSYQLEDEKEQQKILNAFQLDEFGNPKQIANSVNSNQNILTSNVDYSVDHTKPAKLTEGQYGVSKLYSGPSSYSAPQASIGKLTDTQNYNSRLELADDNSNGYPRVSPSPQFTFK